MYCNVCNKYRKSKNVVMNMKKYLKKNSQLKY